MPSKSTKKYSLMPLGEILLELGYITPEQWEAALGKASQLQRDFQDVLLADDLIDTSQLAHAFALQNGLRFWDWSRIERIIRRHKLVHIPPPGDAPNFPHVAWAREAGPSLVIIADLSNTGARMQLRAAYSATAKRVEIVAVTNETLEEARRRARGAEPGRADRDDRRISADTDVLEAPSPLADAEDTSPPVDEEDETGGARVDGYRIERRLAAGAAGVVYLAVRERDGARVAIKRLHPELAANERAVQQMMSERQLLERFDHPNIIRVHGGGLWDGVPYFAMELMPGDSLADRLAAAPPLSVPAVMRLWCEIADALAYAHRMGVLHRDIKPANVLLTETGEAKVVDFGIARQTGGRAGETGSAAGTLLYMAPEQLRGQPLSPASDIYALGMVAFEMLTGELPDANLDLQAMVRRRQQRDISFDDVRRPLTQAMRAGTRLQEVGASLSDFARILHQCLRKNPRDRFTQAEDLSRALRQLMRLRNWAAPAEISLPAERAHAWKSDESLVDDTTTVPTGTVPSDSDETAVASLITAPPAKPKPLVPEDYEVIKALGRGSMGEVFLARDRDTGRQVALKMIAPEMAANKRFRDRFQREAEVLGRLQHPSIVHIFGVQFEGATPHIAMEYIEGRDLDEVLKDHSRLTLEECVPIITQAADALEHVHSHGIIHRDLKPSNLMLTTTGQVKILDFGVAKDSEAVELTKTGAVIGTPHYMSPEQASGKPASPLSDMYALGMIWYQLLVGRVPFRGSIPEVLHQHVAIQPPRVQDAVAVPDSVDNLIARMLRKQAQDRPQSFSEVIRVAEEALKPGSAVGRLWRAVVAPAILTGLGAAAARVGYLSASTDWELDLPADWWANGLMWVGGACVTVGGFTLLLRVVRAARGVPE